jgi:signal transduction histidine kinase
VAAGLPNETTTPIREGNGLVGMRRRAGLMEATLDIRSAPGEGTEISLRVAVG